MDGTSSAEINSHPFKINLIDNENDLDIMAEMIINDNNNPIIGVDCEAALEMSRFGILCLIQVTKHLYKRFLIKKRFI